ncbi:cell division protein FtsI/penicillin-binding protein 2 [Salirhabdus euzebyi]|uniref:serine-type D-Ala-D-Ala carboxypeptidase n=1 Tax=Salirhabdus euzebyi TaxID=394506 RepID=A0A841Q8M3_9BACI|nr:penicillin-binding protein 2 [Salirhabdus euzebyi]MBB6454627.1 cell division protein FtsI/penicillin-binding protein 2 [Salirhabdus euzebyi]
MKKKSHLPFRLNVLFFLIFLLFSLLILQLGVVQILTGEEAQRVLDETEETVTSVPVPRGEMYDRNGNIIVENTPKYAITYTPPKHVQPDEKLDVAQKLASYIKKDDGDVTKRDKKDYWILINHEEAYAKLSDEEKAEMDNEEEYYAVLDRITDGELAQLTEADLEVIAVKRELDQAIELTPHIVKNEEVTDTEYATVAEHLSEMPGVNVTTDWERHLPFHPTFSNFVGGLTSHDEGILRDKADFYLTRQYSRNDRVGKSFLEEQYETILSGQKELYRHITDSQNNILGTELVHEGKQGKSLVLTIDMELQKKIDQIVEEELTIAIENHPGKNRFMKDALVVMMNPKTGEVLSITGKRYYRATDEEPAHVKDESYRVVYDAHLPGSAIKGATVLAGFQSGVINKSTTFFDRPIKIAGTPWKSSYDTLRSVNYLSALERSSNVFMYFIAMRMGGDYTYVENAPLDYDSDAFRQMRNYFKQFGLGIETGIDLPYEATGYEGEVYSPGFLMDYAIGQYEPFTALQLAQYISTIANDGYRVKPHLVKEIRESNNNGELGPIYKVMEPEVINRIEMDQEYIDAVQNGLYRVFNGTRGTAAGTFADKPYVAAGKTGTAQNMIYENGQLVEETENLTLVGYAPYDNPEIAFSIIVPNVGVRTRTGINNKIGERILDAYFELNEEKEGEGEEEVDN